MADLLFCDSSNLHKYFNNSSGNCLPIAARISAPFQLGFDCEEKKQFIHWAWSCSRYKLLKHPLIFEDLEQAGFQDCLQMVLLPSQDFDDPPIRKLLLAVKNRNALPLRQMSSMLNCDVSNLHKYLQGCPKSSLPLLARISAPLFLNFTADERSKFISLVWQNSPLSITSKISLRSPTLSSLRFPCVLKREGPNIGELLKKANTLDPLGKWDQAIRTYREVEAQAGPNRPLAAEAALGIVQIYINLCDYENARRELQWIQSKYEEVMGPREKRIAQIRNGWLSYYSGKYMEAIYEFEEVYRWALKEGELSLLDVVHFLGRAYRDFGLQFNTLNSHFLQTAKEKLIESKAYHRHYGTPQQEGFDHLRLAQFYEQQCMSHEAEINLSEAESFFQGSPSTFHVSLELADRAFKNDNLNRALNRAKEALNQCIPIGYPKGISDALAIQAGVLFAKGKRQYLTKIADLSIASLAIYPYERQNISGTYEFLRRSVDGLDELQRLLWIGGLRERVALKDPPFDLISIVKADRTQKLNLLLKYVDALVPNYLVNKTK